MGSCSGRCTLLALCALQLVSPGILRGSPDQQQPREAPGRLEPGCCGQFSRLTGMRGERPLWGISAVPCCVCLGSGVRAGGDRCWGASGAPRLLGTKAFGRGWPWSCAQVQSAWSGGSWSVVRLMRARSEGACGQECAFYCRGTSGGACSKVQCLSVDIRVGCTRECNRLALPSCT